MKKLYVKVKTSDTLTPLDLIDLMKKLPDLDAPTVVVIGGRLPVWIYGMMVHFYHPAVAVATFDPRFGYGVVVASHNKKYEVGDFVSVDDATVVDVVVGAANND